MSFIRTILGDIPAEALGVCYAHEHIIIDRCFATDQEPAFLLDDVQVAIAELKAFHAAGGRAMVDTMPGGAGRNAIKLAAVSAGSGVHIVCPTGMHLAKYYPPDDPRLKLDVDGLAEWFVREIEHGVYESPADRQPPLRAGIIKIASGRDRLSVHEQRVFDAAALAHRRTGCPIITHTEAGTAAMEQVDRLESGGVDLSRVTLSHTDRLPDVGLHRALLARGVKLEYDSAFRWKPGQGNPTLDLLIALTPDFAGGLMLGMDAARRSYWKFHGGTPGLNFLLETFAAALRDAGVSAEDIGRFFTTNPKNAFTFTASSKITNNRGNIL